MSNESILFSPLFLTYRGRKEVDFFIFFLIDTWSIRRENFFLEWEKELLEARGADKQLKDQQGL